MERTILEQLPDRTAEPERSEGPGNLFFRVSAGLKRIIGRDLITNDFVAIFELVKNSFDAHATSVELCFREGALLIVDDGKGMSASDLEEKWLFVAYSAKRDGSEDNDYRDRIRTSSQFAGSKGVGRFSCDRLGATLRLQTRRAESAIVEVLEVDWSLFEGDPRSDFVNVPVKWTQRSDFDLPGGMTGPDHGTVLEISQLREGWDREKLLDLKAALAKLINPFGEGPENFVVNLNVPSEFKNDQLYTPGSSPLLQGISEDTYHKVVNGPIRNFIFETLRSKTTFIHVEVGADGTELVTELTDRGETVYRIREPNPYIELKGVQLKCQLFYLNQSAKITFSRRMGVPSVQFGSVFLFKNGFRIYPVGEEGDDSFGLDRRKQQGFSRFLGTREVIGRIDVVGSDAQFQESTSRDHGLIRTPAYEQLEELFHDRVLKRLERYVVDISWKDKSDKNFEDISRMLGDTASAKITALVSKLADTDGVSLEKYSPRLIRILNEQSDQFEVSLEGLKALAQKTGDAALTKRIGNAESRYQELKKAEEEARARAAKETLARVDAEARAKKAEEEANRAKAELEQERSRSLFLTSVSSVDYDTVVGLHHQILNYSHDIHIVIGNQLEKINHGMELSMVDLREIFAHLDLRIQQVLQVSRFATKANFKLDSDKINDDLVKFVVQYLERVAPLYGDGMEIITTSSAVKLVREFKPIELTIVLENLISNANKAEASEVTFELSQPRPNELQIIVTDDGTGLSEEIDPPESMFEVGVTTTEGGSGLGLYHVARILDQMGSSIEFDANYSVGARFKIRVFE